MSNALFKMHRLLVVFPPPPPPPALPKPRLVKKSGRRPKYVWRSSPNVNAGGSGRGVVAVLTRDGDESYEYYEWVTDPVVVPRPPAPVVTAIPAGWDASARSAITMTDSVAVEWTVDTGNTDVICGLSTFIGDPPLPAGTAEEQAAAAAMMRASVLHGIRTVGGAAYAHHAPPASFGAVALDQRRASVPVATGSVCRIEITKGIVRYLVNGVLIATGPSYVHRGEGVYMRAALYAPADQVENPAIEGFFVGAEGAATVGPLSLLGGKYAAGRAMFGLYVDAPRRMGIRGTVGPLWARGGRVGGGANLDLPPLGAWGWGIQANGAMGSAVLGPLLLKGAGAAGYGDGTATMGLWAFGYGMDLPPQSNEMLGMDSLIDAYVDTRAHRGAYETAALECAFAVEHGVNRHLPTRMGVASAWRAGRVYPAVLAATLGLQAALKGERVMDVALVAGLGTGLDAVGLLLLTAEFGSALGIADDATGQRLLQGMLRAQMGLDADAGALATYNAVLHAVLGAGVVGTRGEDDYLVWSVEQGGASAAYSGFAFNSFARVGGRIFAASDAGLYELGGDDDDGAPIAAWVDLGQRNFGSMLLKGISNAYLTASSDAKLTVRVTTPEGLAYTYQARRAGTAMQAQRVDFGRGLRATYLNLELTNGGSGDFDLERLEFVVNESKRRI